MSNTFVSENALAKLDFNADVVVVWVKTGVEVVKNLTAAVKKVNEHTQSEKVAAWVEKVESVLALIEKFMNNDNVMNLITLLLKLFTKSTPVKTEDLAAAVLASLAN